MSSEEKQLLITELFPFLKPNDEVLDLGAGLGKQAKFFAENGCKVTAVDANSKVEFKDLSIDWHLATIEDFISQSEYQNEKWSLIFSQNLLQFLEKDFVLNNLVPWIENHLVLGGLVAIRTFYQNPEPPFPKPLVSLYQLNELMEMFSGWQVILGKQFDQIGPSLDGSTRRFFCIDFIIKKPAK